MNNFGKFEILLPGRGLGLYISKIATYSGAKAN